MLYIKILLLNLLEKLFKREKHLKTSLNNITFLNNDLFIL